MPTFERYLLKKLLIGFITTLSILMLIIGSRLLTRLLDRVSGNDYSIDSILTLLSIGLINSFTYLLPFSAMLSAILVLRSFYYSNEMCAAFSLRISRIRIYKVLVYFGVPLAIMLLYIVMEIIPQFNYHYLVIKEKSKQHIALQMLPVGKFTSLQSGGVLFIEKYDNENINGVFVADANASAIESAPLGRRVQDAQSGDMFELQKGSIYQNNGALDNFTLFTYDNHRIWIPPTVPEVRYKPSMMSFSQLVNNDSASAQAQWQLRLAIPISLLLLLLLAEPLSRTAPRQSSYFKIILGIVTFLLYINLISFVVKLIEKGDIPVYPGVWGILLGFLLVIIWFSKNQRISTQ